MNSSSSKSSSSKANRRYPDLHINLSSPSTSYSSNQGGSKHNLEVISPTNDFRSRSRSPSRSTGVNLDIDIPPVPDSSALPSPSNPFQYEFSPSPESFLSPSSRFIDPARYELKRWNRIIMKRNCQPTPLGYALLSLTILSVLYLLSGSNNDTHLLPSSWSSTPSTNELPYDDLEHPEDDVGTIEQPDLPSLPSIYSSHFPSLSLPLSFDVPKYYHLSTKLTQFLYRPVQAHDEAKESNYEGCPRELSDKLVNPDQYNGDAQFWIEDVKEEEIAKRRYDVVRWLEEAIERGEEVIGRKDGSTGKGRGIVLTGGNQDTTLRTITAIKHLRRLNVDLPIEVFHYSDELTDGNQRGEIENLGATLREAKGLSKVEGVWKNWQVSVVHTVLSLLY
ncbi:uncharacterized protein I206_103743 [Kwoniella pini CBS 10737]|uniref:Uncharacterized protein n=1 Tax=Kwoniella pini CBS 10737 TaxID=1296096 RepID=A0AAJ8L6L3_9TREE